MDNVCLAIVGSRHYNDYTEFERIAKEHIDTLIPDTQCSLSIVSGGATGTDTLAHRYAKKYNIPFIVHHAQWTLYKLAAGPIRNTLIVNDCTHVLAFRAKTSTGTDDTIRKARAQGKPVTIIDIQ